MVPWAALGDVTSVAPLLGEAPGDLRALLATVPGTVEGVAVLEEGRPIAAALWIPSLPGSRQLDGLARLGAPPDRPDAALRLVAWAEERARRMGASALRITERAGGAHGRVLQARGYAVVNALVRMRRGALRPVPPLPGGVVERALADAGLDAWVAVSNASFEGIPFNISMTPADAARQAADPAFDPSLLRVLVDAAGPVGFLRGVLAQDRVGAIESIGVVARARRAGLGRWLLRRCGALLDARGAREVDLQVAETNAPAIALCLQEGYTEISRRVAWERTVP